MQLNEIVDHIRNRTYMSGIERDTLRVKATGEVFTPTELVQEVLDQIPLSQFTDPSKTFLDPSCGDGQFLSEVLIRKIENGSSFEQALSTIYGVDLMQDNVDLCRERLLCGQEHLRHIVEKNIVCHNSITYNYTFGEPEIFGNGMFEVLAN
jgi:type I restriction-modification system DNA methylase subunit